MVGINVRPPPEKGLYTSSGFRKLQAIIVPVKIEPVMI
jgi:hypothetical protein